MYGKFIVWINRQAPSLGRIVLLLAATQIYKHSDYKQCYPFHGAQYLPDLLHECRHLSLELIA